MREEDNLIEFYDDSEVAQNYEDRKERIEKGGLIMEVFDENSFLEDKSIWLKDLFKKIDEFCLGVQAGVKRTVLHTYIRYTHRGKMFAKIVIKQEHLKIYLRLEYEKLEQKPKFIRDYTPVAKQTWIELYITENELLKNETILLDVTCELIKQSFTRVLENPTLSRFPTFGKKAVKPEFINPTRFKLDLEVGSDGFIRVGLRIHKTQLPKLLEKLIE